MLMYSECMYVGMYVVDCVESCYVVALLAFLSGLCATLGDRQAPKLPTTVPSACDFTLVIHQQIHSLAK